jgi:hypothetical protein
MKKVLTAAILVAIITLSGCLSALHPLFTEKDLEFDPKLVGSWQVGTEDEVLTFQQGTPESFANLPAGLQQLAGKAYVLTVTSRKTGEEMAKFYAFLARIGKHVYLDYYPAETKAQRGHPEFFKNNFMPMHSFFRLQPGRDGKTITISQFSDSYLRKLISEKKIRIRHEVSYTGDYVITAPTEELQQYVLKYSDVDEAYNENKTYSRIQ